SGSPAGPSSPAPESSFRPKVNSQKNGSASASESRSDADCDTLTVFDAIVSVPVRGVVPLKLGGTRNRTVPAPIPLPGSVTTAKSACEAAFHVHVSFDAITSMERSPPAGLSPTSVDDSRKLHGASAG